MPRESQNCFERAIEIALKEGAKSWELRAIMCITHVLAKQGRRDETHAILADIYGGEPIKKGPRTQPRMAKDTVVPARREIRYLGDHSAAGDFRVFRC
jgi:hypothetical protein